MARASTSRRQETLFVPFVEEAGERLDGVLPQYAVKVRDGAGSKIWLTDVMPKRVAARRLREIREAMYRAWDAKPLPHA